MAKMFIFVFLTALLLGLVGFEGNGVGQPGSPRKGIWFATNSEKLVICIVETSGESSSVFSGWVSNSAGACLFSDSRFDYGSNTFTACFVGQSKSNNMEIKYLEDKGEYVLGVLNGKEVKFFDRNAPRNFTALPPRRPW